MRVKGGRRFPPAPLRFSKILGRTRTCLGTAIATTTTATATAAATATVAAAAGITPLSADHLSPGFADGALFGEPALFTLGDIPPLFAIDAQDAGFDDLLPKPFQERILRFPTS
jgi:hypothetical protein